MLQINTTDFILDGQKDIIISAEIHYFRIDPIYWERVIQSAKDIGCNTISYYVPWYIHEPSEGEFDFTGLNNAKYNLEKWQELVKESGLNVIFRPGPYIYAEMTNLGLPNWLVDNYSDQRTMFYNDGRTQYDEFKFSFAHNNELFLKKTENYFAALHKYIKQIESNIIMIQLCNEIPGLDIDDATETSNSNRSFNDFMKEQFTSFELESIFEIKEGQTISKNALREHKHYKNIHLKYQYGVYFLRYFQNLKKMYDRLAIDTNFVHNAYNPRAISLFSEIKRKVPSLCIGIDNYFSLKGCFNAEAASYYCDFAYEYSNAILRNPVFALEHESGFWLDTPKISPKELYIHTLYTFLSGYRGINMYLFHGGVNEIGMGFNDISHEWQAPFDSKANKNDKYEALKNAIFEAQNNKDVIFEKTVYECAIIFEHFPGLIWKEISQKCEDFFHWLWQANVSSKILDISKADNAELLNFKNIFILVNNEMSKEMQRRIIDLIELGVNITIVGNLPTKSYYNECTDLIDHLGVTIKKDKQDSFSQKIQLDGNEILYDVDNLDIIESDFHVLGCSSLNAKPILLNKNNVCILNGFLKHTMKSQKKILKKICELKNVETLNINSEIHILEKENNYVLLNPYNHTITSDVIINSEKTEYTLSEYSVRIIKKQ